VSDYEFGDEARWLIIKFRFGAGWVAIRPMEAGLDNIFDSWREAMDFVIQEAGL
jgi:hypothetical protein